MKITAYQSKGITKYKWSGYIGTDAVGKLSTKRSGFLSKRDAELDYHRYVGEFNAGMHHRKPDDDVTNLADLFKLWWRGYAPTVAPPTRLKAKRQIEIHYLPKYGDKSLDYFTPTKVQMMMFELAETINVYQKTAGYLRRMFKLAVSLELIERNPFDKVDMPKAHKVNRQHDKVLDSDKFKVFLRLVDELFSDDIPVYTLMRLLAFTGMRRGEALGLKWIDVDFNNGRIHIHRSMTRDDDGKQMILDSAKTEAGNRVLTLDNETMRIISQHYNYQTQFGYSDSDYTVFTTQKGAFLPLSAPTKWFNKIVDASSGQIEHLTPHTLRHTFITLAIENGLSVKQVQYMVGHADVTMTMQVYNHITAKQAESAGVLFANAVTKMLD